MDFDVIVIGGGPAGAIAAIKLGKKHRILILEKTNPSQIKHSGEYIPKLLLLKEPIGKKAIIQEVEGLITYLSDDRENFVKAPGYIIDRKIYNGELVESARELGCEIKLETRATIVDGHVIAHQNRSELNFNASIYIGADGSYSHLRRKLMTQDQHYVVTLVRELSLTKELKYSYVYFHPLIFGGYAWLFPMGKKASCGVGIDITRARSLKQAWQVGYEKFKKAGLVQSSSILNEYYNIIYTGGPNKKCVYKNIILVGDAAGQVHPITGAGIGQAVICSQILAEKCLNVLRDNNLNYLEDYEKEWRALYEKELWRGLLHRQEMIKDWNKEPFDKIIQNNWVTFDEYYND